VGWLRAVATDRESLRSWTLVANDGMLSVGGVEWAETAAERNAQLSAADEETLGIAQQPEVAHAEIAAYYESKGLTPQLAREVADQLMAADPLDAQLESEHGILEITTRAETVRAGVGSAVAYLLGAGIPLAVTVVAPVAFETWLILAAAVISLILTSAIGARTGRTNREARPLNAAG
jgi:VIT1/CCC1 family predicted Fe2+/Mn2+ transporter